MRHTVAGLIARKQKMESSSGMNVAEDRTSSPELTSQTVSSVPTHDTSSVSNERVFKQSELDSIVKREKQKAYDSGMRSVSSNQMQNNYESSNTVQSAPAHNQTSSYNESQIRQIAAQEAEKTRDQIYAEAQQQNAKAQWDRVSQTFDAKIASGKEKYKDFDTVANIDMTGYPAVKQILAEHVDNSADLLYALGKDRFKLAQLEQMGRDSYQWRDAIVQAKRLAESIKENEKAAQVQLPNEPLSQMRSFPTSLGNSGKLSFKDLKAKYRI